MAPLRRVMYSTGLVTPLLDFSRNHQSDCIGCAVGLQNRIAESVDKLRLHHFMEVPCSIYSLLFSQVSHLYFSLPYPTLTLYIPNPGLGCILVNSQMSSKYPQFISFTSYF